MAFEEDPKFETFIASVNVSALSYTSTDGSTINYASGGIGYGCAVKHDVATGISGDVILAGVSGDKALGICGEAPAVTAGQNLRVCIRGVCKAQAGAAVAVGDTVMVGNAAGQLITATAATANFVVGRALTAATALGDLFSVEVRITDGKVTLP